MKKQILTIAILLLTLTTSTFAQSSNTAVNIKTKIYCDHCSQCGSCQARIEKKVLELKGVKSVKLDVDNERIKVSFNPTKTTVKNIRTQINKAGFDADDQKATAEYVAELDGCCKK